MYSKRAASVDGLQYRCKECERPGYLQRELIRKRAAKAAYVREWRKRNPEHVRSYNAATQDKRNAHNSRAKFRSRVAARLIETEAVYTLWCNLTERAERAEPIDPRELIAEWERNGTPNTCRNGCGNVWREIVHVVPLPEGGEHAPANLAPQCGKRNCSPAGTAAVATATHRPSKSTM